MTKHSDLDLTIAAAKFCGFEIFPFPDGMGAIIGILCKYDGAVFYFNPLSRRDDLDKVVVRLPVNKVKILILIEDPPRFEIVNTCGFGEMSVLRDLYIKEGKYPQGYARAILTLASEIGKEEGR
jgi:hypothetical protein